MAPVIVFVIAPVMVFLKSPVNVEVSVPVPVTVIGLVTVNVDSFGSNLSKSVLTASAPIPISALLMPLNLASSFAVPVRLPVIASKMILPGVPLSVVVSPRPPTRPMKPAVVAIAAWPLPKRVVTQSPFHTSVFMAVLVRRLPLLTTIARFSNCVAPQTGGTAGPVGLTLVPCASSLIFWPAAIQTLPEVERFKSPDCLTELVPIGDPVSCTLAAVVFSVLCTDLVVTVVASLIYFPALMTTSPPPESGNSNPNRPPSAAAATADGSYPDKILTALVALSVNVSAALSAIFLPLKKISPLAHSISNPPLLTLIENAGYLFLSTDCVLELLTSPSSSC